MVCTVEVLNQPNPRDLSKHLTGKMGSLITTKCERGPQVGVIFSNRILATEEAGPVYNRKL